MSVAASVMCCPGSIAPIEQDGNVLRLAQAVDSPADRQVRPRERRRLGQLVFQFGAGPPCRDSGSGRFWSTGQQQAQTNGNQRRSTECQSMAAAEILTQKFTAGRDREPRLSGAVTIHCGSKTPAKERQAGLPQGRGLVIRLGVIKLDICRGNHPGNDHAKTIRRHAAAIGRLVVMSMRARTPALDILYHQYLVDQDTAQFSRRVQRQYNRRLARTAGRHWQPHGAPRRRAWRSDCWATTTRTPRLGRALHDDDRGVRMLAESGIRQAMVPHRRHRAPPSARHDRRVQLHWPFRTRRANLASRLIDKAPWLAEGWNQRALAHVRHGSSRRIDSRLHANAGIESLPLSARPPGSASRISS